MRGTYRQRRDARAAAFARAEMRAKFHNALYMFACVAIVCAVLAGFFYKLTGS